jgi:hypothetical protein
MKPQNQVDSKRNLVKRAIEIVWTSALHLMAVERTGIVEELGKRAK